MTPFSINVKPISYAFLGLGSKKQKTKDRMIYEVDLEIDGDSHTTKIDLGPLDAKELRELSAHLRDIADDINPQEEN